MKPNKKKYSIKKLHKKWTESNPKKAVWKRIWSSILNQPNIEGWNWTKKNKVEKVAWKNNSSKPELTYQTRHGSQDWDKFIESRLKNYEAPLPIDLILKVEIEKKKN